MRKYIENNLASFQLENGILYIIYKENITIRLLEAMEIVAQRLTLQQDKPYPILCNIKGVRDIARDASAYLAVEGTVLIKALALVYKTPLSKIFSKLYIDESLPVKMELFTDETKALEFLIPFSCSTSV